ncbi:C39 family peptidase [Sporolactobacillus terrae]|uniref:C39 family peptidase n=1 Tax=Sporolactobacillus terrae TaxID=269673 RepID=UPI001F0DAAD9|nr:C39 family peptidase [Sporolactobacillus terrae]
MYIILLIFLAMTLIFYIYSINNKQTHLISIYSNAVFHLRSLFSDDEKSRSVEVDNARIQEIELDIPLIRQKPKLARGCEVTSLAMLLQSAGKPVSKMTLAKQIRKVPYIQNGLHGDPNEEFVGEMYAFKRPGYGVYHKPLAELASRYLPNQIEDQTGKPFVSILDQLRKEIPVVVITNTSFKSLPKKSFISWQTRKGNVKITFHEHAVLITGFTDDKIYINNPLGGKNEELNRNDFEKAWRQMGKQAISYSIPMRNK